MVNITPTDEKILMTLAMGEPKTYYDLWKHEKVASSNKTVLQALRGLLTTKLIVIKHKEIASGQGLGGRNKKFYGLTETGLLQTLMFEEAWRHIDKIAYKQADKIPLIFGKWSFFIEKGVRNMIVRRCMDATCVFLVELTQTWIRVFRSPQEEKGKIIIEAVPDKLQKVSREHREFVRRLTNRVLGLEVHPVYLPPKERNEVKQLIQISREDPELHSYYKKGLTAMDQEETKIYENLRAWREWFESLGT